jgi:hypothetical protein
LGDGSFLPLSSLLSAIIQRTPAAFLSWNLQPEASFRLVAERDPLTQTRDQAPSEVN